MLTDDIKFLGVEGSRQVQGGTTCVQVADNILIDAGNIIQGLGDSSYKIEHIFLTHSHLDHIVDIAFLVDNNYLEMKKPLKIYGLEETINALKKHIFNNTIWPDFQNISLEDSHNPTIEFITLELYKEYVFETVTLKPIPISHTVPTTAYVIKKKNFSTLFATDTYITSSMWETLDLDESISSLIIDVSFPSKYEELSYHSKHLTPKLLSQELKKSQRDLDIYITHLKSSFKKEIRQELAAYGLLEGKNRILKSGEYLIHTSRNRNINVDSMKISTLLSKEKDLGKILEMILQEAISYTHSEGGTIYLKEGDNLLFKSIMNSKLGIHINNPSFPPIRLFIEGKENSENVSARAALTKTVVNVPDIYRYNIDGFSFEGVKKFDKENNYRTHSMLVIPMLNQDNEVIGVIQLINKCTADASIPYEQEDIELTTTYANWAATAISKNRLVEDLEALLLSFLEAIAVALSAKSPYGYGHVQKVAQLMKVISKKVDEDNSFYQDIHYTEEELKELEVAAWMHDIGKIAIPEHIIDKSTKLETIHDRISEIKMRYRYLKSALKAQMLEEKLQLVQEQKSKEAKNLEEEFNIKMAALDDEADFLAHVNQPSTKIGMKEISRIESIAERTYTLEGESFMLLSLDEVENLSVKNGTLTEKERFKINEHAAISNKMLEMLTFPKKFSRVKEIASAHHEKLNGTGYPEGLHAKDISFEGRLMAVVDIFEALTANDRPYKSPKTIQETFEILEGMAQRNEIDKTIVEFLKETKAYEEYAHTYLLKEQYEEKEKEDLTIY